MNDKQRADFEAWYVEHFKKHTGRKDFTLEVMQSMRGLHNDYRENAYLHGLWIGYQAALQSQSVALLAKKHTGMMVDYTGLIGQARSALKHGERSPALAEMLNQLARHIKKLGEGWYSGDTAVVDEFLQLYCVEDDARRRIEGDGE